MDTSKSSSLELSLKNQSESFAPCNKLNSAESKPNVTLKKMGEELDIAETKCLTLKSELNYMMGVCQKAQTEIKRSKAAFDISQEPMLSSKSPRLKLPVECNDDNNEITVTNKMSNYNVFQKLCNTEKKAKENFDSTHLSPRFAEFSTRKNVDDHNIVEKTDNLICQTIDGRQKGLLSITITPKGQSDQKFSPTMSQISVENDRIKATEHENSLSCLSECVREHFQSMLRLEGSVEELTSKTDRDDYSWTIRPSSVQTDIKVPESSANVADVAKARRTKKSNRATKTERNESSVCKTIDTASRVRKRKGKLRSFTSKSTLTTKDISSVDRKRCRRKARNLATSSNIIHPQSIPIKHAKQSKEILEIFHNTTLKSSHSGISSKYSKFSGQAKTVKQQHVVKTNVNQKIQEQLPSEQIDHKNQCYSSENQQVHQLSNQSNLRTTPEDVQQQNKFTKPSINSSSPIQCKTPNQCENAFDRYVESSFTPSYEMPTLASRLKRSSKSYFSRFNFQNIPFVVGTSVTPSHNLGLNIQQVLSVMKMRQPLANDIVPLLIQKGGGMSPVSTFLERINRQCGNSSRQITGAFNSRLSLNTGRDKKFSALDLRNVGRAQNVRVPDVSDNVKLLSERDNNAEQFPKEKIDEHKIKRQFSSVVNKSTLSANAKDQREISTAMNKHKISNCNTHTSASRNSKEIRDVLINLHNQFEEMNTKYEKLESEVEKSNDKSLAKELSTLEKELSVKEEEINAVISLYKEVTALKQQMKMLHEKNSLVCIELAKETPRKDPFFMSILSDKSQSIKPTEIFGRRKAFGATREPPAAVQLAALLRQIQTFHKQLQLVS